MTDARTPILRRFLCLAVCAALALSAMAPAAGAAAKSGADSVGFGVAPLRYDVEAAPGKTTTHPITITNTDSVAATYTFSKVDFQGDKSEPEATPVLLAGKLDSAISGYDWLGLPNPVTVPAGGARTVDVRVTAPSGATGGHYAAVVVGGATRSAGEVVAQSRIAVLFMMNAGGVPPPDIVITDIKQVGPTTTVTEFVNPGKTETTPKGTITTEDPVTNRKLRETEGTCTTALPGGSGKCVFETGKGKGKGQDGGRGSSAPGDTVANSPSGLEKDYIEVGDPRGGKGERTRAEMPTEWAGTWSSMLLPLVGIALFVLYFLFLRRRRKDEEEEADLAFDGAAFD